MQQMQLRWQTMPEHANAETLRAFYLCFEHADYPVRVREFLAPSVVWHVAGDNPLAGNFRGPNAVTEQMLRYEEHSRGTLRLDSSILATDTHAVAIHIATASIPDVTYSAHEVDVFHIENGLITEFWSFSEDQTATDRMSSRIQVIQPQPVPVQDPLTARWAAAPRVGSAGSMMDP
jgi:ketosteroid isomerase-like protein